MTAPRDDILGQRFGAVTAVEELPRVNGMRNWRLHCDCGNERIALQKVFARAGGMVSCGCQYRRPDASEHSKRPEYRHWVNMIMRCEYDHPQFRRQYQDRGITVCGRWRKSFRAFFDDMGPRPSPKHSLDRIDVNGNYEPGNVRWATQTEQMRNIRRNRIVVAFGHEMTLAEAVEKSGLLYNTVLYRLKRGWPLDLALSQSLARGRRPTWEGSDAA